MVAWLRHILQSMGNQGRDMENDRERTGADCAPAMTAAETEMFLAYVNKAPVYVEFGCGGSTCAAAAVPSVQRIYAVESDKAWIAQIMQTPSVRKRLAERTIFFHHADIGATQKWGHPASGDPHTDWTRYYWAAWQHLPACVDFVLVDGRFRVATVLACLLALRGDSYHIGVHDYADRPEYHVVQQFLVAVDTVDTLTVFAPKPRRDVRGLFLALHKYAWIPA